jgi:hypothetical protein
MENAPFSFFFSIVIYNIFLALRPDLGFHHHPSLPAYSDAMEESSKNK